MYAETHPVRFRGGIHNGTLDALAPFSAHGLRIGGLDPSDFNNWDALQKQYRDPNAQVEIGVENPDPQTARDIATVARHTIWNGRNLWPGRVLPPERFNQAANYLRQHEGLPQEGTMQITPTARVSGDMSVTSKWTVVALGELQQPGGVGASQDYNPVVDGPNPEGPNIADNATNSPEQEVALQTWVNMAVDLLNRGEDPQAIIAKLAHDGCPDPQAALARAQQQPDTSPVSDEIGQDPFEAPASPDPSQNGEMQGLSQQPPVMAKTAKSGKCEDCGKESNNLSFRQGDGYICDDCGKRAAEAENSIAEYDRKNSKRVRIAGTTMTGTEIDRWEGLWGEGTVKVALDGGGTLDVDPSAVEPIDAGSFKHPVSEIQQFIDSMPKVEPTRPHIEARLVNLELVRRAVRANISKCSFSDQVKLQQFDSAAKAETALLKEVLANHHEDYEVAYAKAARRFQYNAFEVATPEITPYAGNAREAGAIWATENFDGAIDDNQSFVSAAAHFASSVGLTGTQFEEFLAGAEEHRTVRTEEFTATEPEITENEGPAEALFV